MQCIGYWKENLKSYLITYDQLDAFTKYRCWVYQRWGGSRSCSSSTSIIRSMDCVQVGIKEAVQKSEFTTFLEYFVITLKSPCYL